MNKRGKFYVTLVCGFMIIMLIIAYVNLSKYYSKNNQLGITKDIGTKQASVIQAVLDGERIELYVQEAAKLAAGQAGDTLTCGEDYLNTKLIGTGACTGTTADNFMAAFNGLLSQYPGSLTDISWKKSSQDANIVLQGVKRIPVGFQSIQTGTFNGIYTGWPTDDKEVTDLFGNRDIQVADATKDHPGLDIRSNGKTDQAVYSLTDGDAAFHDNGQYSYVRVKTPDVIIDYMHVYPSNELSSGNVVQVKAGQQIATTRPFIGGAHVHLQVQLASVTAKTIQNLGWVPARAGPSNVHTGMIKSYAVLKGNEAYLDPVCFFDRQTITAILQKKYGQNPLPADTFEACDAYEKEFGLNKQFATTNQPSQAPPSPPTQQPVPAAPNTNYAEVTTTQQALQNLMPVIAKAASDTGVDEALLLAIITQESKGDPNAVSWTGCAGIAQFCYRTATDYEPEIFQKLTQCECAGNACKSEQTRKCTQANDDRFDAQKSIAAEAQKVKDELDTYSDYDQKLAFAIAAYNGGDCPVKDAIKQTGKGTSVSWDDVRAAIQSMPDNACGGSDKQQIIDYVDKVMRWYEAWGGHSFAGTVYTSQQYGYYDLRLAVSTTVPASFSTILSDMQDALLKAQSQDEIQQIVMSYNKNGFSVQPETLETVKPAQQTAGQATSVNLPPPPQSGCLNDAERSQAYVANQLETCKRSPSSTCTCDFASNANAEYDITPAELKISKDGSRDVPEGDVDSMEGVSYNPGGDQDTATLKQYKLDSGALTVTSDSGTAEATLTLSSGTANVVYVGKTSAAGQSAGITGTSSGEYDATKLYKGPDALGFTAETTLDACIPYPTPQAYCLHRTGDLSDSVVFYVDMAAHSKVEDSPVLTAYNPEQGNLKDIKFTGDPYPYVHAIITKPDRTVTNYYLRVYNYGDRPIAQMAGDSQQAKYWVLRQASNYETMLPREGPDKLTLQFMDENLREGPILDVADKPLIQPPAQPAIPVPSASPSDATSQH